jgi:Na+/proline symporter
VSLLSDFVYELVPGVIVSTLVIVIVSLLTTPPAGAAELDTR